jgi:hypothetical protein
MTTVKLKTKVDNTLSVIKDIKKLTGFDVLVGIPEENADRTNEDGSNADINNAQLLYIHSKGSPIQRIPPRPLMEPALEASGNKERIDEDLKEAAQLMLDGKPEAAIKALHRAGIDGVNIIREWFDDPRNNWPPNKAGTVRAKLKKKYKSKKALKRKMEEYLSGKEGMDSVLIDTSQMKDAIVYSVEVNKE